MFWFDFGGFHGAAVPKRLYNTKGILESVNYAENKSCKKHILVWTFGVNVKPLVPL